MENDRVSTEGTVQVDGGRPFIATGPADGELVPGVTAEELLAPFVGKKVRVTVEVTE